MTENQEADLRRELGALGLAFLWLLGRPLGGLPTPTAPEGSISFYQPVNLWKVQLAQNTWVHVQYAPNAFHRGMQRLAFGVRWYCVV
jgi:hypothetical protein